MQEKDYYSIGKIYKEESNEEFMVFYDMCEEYKHYSQDYVFDNSESNLTLDDIFEEELDKTIRGDNV